MASSDMQPDKEPVPRVLLVIFWASIANCLLYFFAPSVLATLGSAVLDLAFELSLDHVIDDKVTVQLFNAVVGFFVLPQIFSLVTIILLVLMVFRRVLFVTGFLRKAEIENIDVFGMTLAAGLVSLGWNFLYFITFTDEGGRASGMPLGFNIFVSAFLSWMVTSVAWAVFSDPETANRKLRTRANR
ncbi:MAG: hypothetical protein AB8B47_16720 [Roseobacter sp.]